MRVLGLLMVAGLLLPGLSLAQVQRSNSFARLADGTNYKSWQAFKCEESDLVTDPAGEGPAGGEDCDAGDWSMPMDCRGMDNMTVDFFANQGDTDLEALVWSCKPLSGATTEGGAKVPSDGMIVTPAPVDIGETAPDGSDNGDSFICTDATAMLGATSPPLDGIADTGRTQVSGTGGGWGHIIVELQAGAVADAVAVVTCGR